MKRLIMSVMLLPVLFVGCATITRYDQNSYNAAIEIKTQSAYIMESAKQTQYVPTNSIVALQQRLSAQAAYENGKGAANKLSAWQWQLLARSDGHLLGGFLKDWLAGKTFSLAYVAEQQKQIGAAFDEILRLEGGKQR